MAAGSKADELISEGIDLSSDLIKGIYNSKKRKTIIIFSVLFVLLVVVVIILLTAGYITYAAPLGGLGIIILGVLLVHSIKELQSLKRELDALNHYISY